MEILFKNKTKYTKQAYAKYLQFHQEKYGLKYKFNTIVTILLLCFCIILNLKYSNIITTLIFVIILITFIIYRFFYPAKKVQKELKTDKFKKEKEFTFTFYKNYFIVSDRKFSDKLSYRKIRKIYETKDFFYLYINIDHAFLLDKSSFSIGNPSYFMEFIKSKKLTFYVNFDKMSKSNKRYKK